MTLGQAKESIENGGAFGDCYPQLAADDDRAALKEWFVTSPKVPVARGPATAGVPKNGTQMLKNGHKLRKEATGDCCPDCGGLTLVRTGSCVTCQDCGRNEGCG